MDVDLDFLPVSFDADLDDLPLFFDAGLDDLPASFDVEVRLVPLGLRSLDFDCRGVVLDCGRFGLEDAVVFVLVERPRLWLRDFDRGVSGSGGRLRSWRQAMLACLQKTRWWR